MNRIKAKRPSPAFLLAIAALVAALGGSAVADQAMTAKKKGKLTKKQRKQVKKLADKRIAKKESALNVNSAKRADTATSAQSATNAVNATNAGNADKVDGKDASQLQTPSAYAQRTDDLELTGDNQDVVETSVQTGSARIIATASANVEGFAGNDHLVCQIRIGGANGNGPPSGPLYASYIPDISDPTDQIVALTFARTVSPGTHSVALQCLDNLGGDVFVDDADLSVIATPV